MRKKYKLAALFLALSLLFCSCGVVTFDFPDKDSPQTSKPSENAQTSEENPPKSDSDGPDSDSLITETPSRFAALEETDVPSRNERENAALKYFKELPKTDMNGATFFITCADDSAIVPKFTTDTLKKNTLSLIENKYDVSIVAAESDPLTMLAELKTAVNSGSYYSDLITVPLKDMGAFIASGMLMNIYSLPYLDLNACYIDSSATMACAADKALYGVGGDMFFDLMKTSALYCNKELLRSGGVNTEEMYDAVRTGSFTWDLFFEYTAAATAPFIDSGVDKGWVEISSDYKNDAVTDLVFYSTGSSYIKTEIGKTPVAGFDFSLSGSAEKKVFDIVKNVLSLEFYAYDDSTAAFRSGVSLWYFSTLNALDEIADSAINFGILPLPKGAGTDEYVSVGDSETQVFAVPKNNNNYAEMSAVISAFLALGHRRSAVNTDEFVQNAMFTSLRDSGSAASLERMFFTQRFDYTMTRTDADAQTRDLLYGLLAEAAE